jgi:hypothetical protein
MVAACKCSATRPQSFHSPRVDCRSRLQSNRGGSLSDNEHFEHAILNKELRKFVSIEAVIRV